MLAVGFPALPPAKLIPIYIWQGEPEHVDFIKRTCSKLLRLCKRHQRGREPRPMDQQSAILTTRPQCSTMRYTACVALLFL